MRFYFRQIKCVSTIIVSLSQEFTILYKWFYNHFMVLNPDKCLFMLLGVDNSLQANLVCSDEILKNTKQEKVLRVTLENKLSFAKNANKKFNSLTRVQEYMTTD